MSTLSSRLSLLVLILLPLAAHALTTAFLYQGRLAQGGAAPTGSYDFTCTLYDAATDGAQVGDPVSLPGVAVANGLFVVPLDFGAAPFQGADRWLEVAVRVADGVSYTVLAPRQPLAPTPYALFARAVNWDDILNRPAAFGVYTAGPGLTLAGQEFAIAAGGVATAMLADGAVTAAKLASDAAGLAKVTGGGMAMNGTKVGIGTAAAGFPLSFSNALGDKIALWGSTGNSYGFGIQSSLLQVHTETSGADIAFGYGSSSAMTETMRIKGTGNVGIGTSAPGTKLEVNGTAKMTGFQLGSSATAGQVLTASATGVGTWASLPASLPPSGTAGGDLTGTYPNPTIAVDAVGNTKLANDAASLAKTSGGIMTASWSGVTVGPNGAPDELFQVYGTGSTPMGVEQLASNATYSGGQQPWQSFTAPADTTLAALEVLVQPEWYTPAATLSLYSGEGTGGTVLASQAVAIATGPGTRTFVLTTPVALTAGAQYTFAITGVSHWAYLRMSTGNPYAGGRAWFNSAYDMVFTLYAALGTTGRAALMVDWHTLNVGIGTGSPGFPLTFANALGDKISLWGQSGDHFGFGIQSNLLQIFSGASAADIAFGYGSSSAMTETMRIKGTGNVGIGTSAPAAKLDVNGTAKMTGFQLGASATAGQVLTASAAGVGTWQALPAAPTTLPPSGAAGGDLTGTYPNPTVGTGKIDSAKILDATIAAADLAANAVTTAKILDANVTTAKLADGAVTTAKLADSAVTSAKLASDAASLDKVSGGVMASLAGGIAIGDNPAPGPVFQVSAAPNTALGVESLGETTFYRGSQDLWQSFTAPSGANSLAAIQLKLSPEGTGTATLTVYSGEGIAGAVLATKTVNLTPGAGFFTFALTTPIALTAGQKYTFGLGNFAPWMTVPMSDDGYGGGTSWYAGFDVVFRLFSAVGATYSPALTVDPATGYVGIDTSMPGYPLHVNGRVAGVGAYLNLSDARFKTNIRPLTAALTRIGRLQGVEFDWTRDGTRGFRFDDAHQLGFLAQEVEKVVPEAVTRGADGVYSMSYTTLIPLLVEGMKEQQAADDARQRQLDALQAENAKIRAENAALRELLTTLSKRVQALEETK